MIIKTILYLLLTVSIPRDTDYIDTVEINIFGIEPVRVSIIYRDVNNDIIDWRWFTTKNQIPKSLGDGRYIAVWEDEKRPRTVICKNIIFTRSKEDKELIERNFFPAERRRKLSR